MEKSVVAKLIEDMLVSITDSIDWRYKKHEYSSVYTVKAGKINLSVWNYAFREKYYVVKVSVNNHDVELDQNELRNIDLEDYFNNLTNVLEDNRLKEKEEKEKQSLLVIYKELAKNE